MSIECPELVAIQFGCGPPLRYLAPAALLPLQTSRSRHRYTGQLSIGRSRTTTPAGGFLPIPGTPQLLVPAEMTLLKPFAKILDAASAPVVQGQRTRRIGYNTSNQ